MSKTLRAAGLVFLLFGSAAARQQSQAEKQAPAPVPAASLKLELKIDKNEVVRGESVPFELVLTNAGTEPVDVCDPSPKNRAFTVRIAGGGKTLTADTMSVAGREGETVEAAPAKPSMKTIAAGEQISIQGDLTTWFGGFGPGDFAVTAGYTGPPKFNVPSNKITLKVAQPAPVYARTGRHNLFLDQQTQDTTWINHSGSGFDLFWLSASPKNPDVWYSNRRIASLSAAQEPIPCSYNVPATRLQLVVWAADGNLQVLRVPQNGPPEGPAAVNLPDDDLKVVETPYADQDNNLHVVLATADGKSAGLLQVPAGEGRPAFARIEPNPPLSAQRALLWGKDGVFCLVWLSADFKSVYAASADLSEVPSTIAPRKVFSSPLVISDLQLTQRFNNGREIYEFVLVLLGLDRGREAMQVRRVDVRTGNVEADERFSMPGLKGMNPFASALREDLTPVYMFLDWGEGVWIAQPRVGRLTPVSDSAGAPVTKACFPELVLTSKNSRVPGIYVRFIDGGKRIAVVKVG